MISLISFEFFVYLSSVQWNLSTGKCPLQGLYRSWKTWKVMEFYNFMLQAWKVLKFGCGSWKVMENQYAFYK